MEVSREEENGDALIIDLPPKKLNAILDARTRNEGHIFKFLFEVPSYETFYQDCILENCPCILTKGTTEEWGATKSWVDQHGEPGLQDLCEIYGKLEVPVANCSEKYFDSQPKTEQTLQEYVNYMQHESRHEILYLKDWHFHSAQRRLCPSQPAVYSTPSLFSSDWLNEFWESRPERADDFRFVYVGVAGTWTPFHADVFRSFSWSANVCGRKRWILLPPGEEQKLHSLSGMPYDVATVLDAENSAAAVSSTSLSEASAAASVEPIVSPGGVRYYDVIQEPGEVVFVPSGWYHQVWNLRDTISINHNWFNAANVDRVCHHLLTSLDDVRAELSDIADDSDEWLAQCQTLLKATHGMSLADFAELLCFVATRRLAGLAGSPVRGLDGALYGRGHMLWDLRCAGDALRHLMGVQDVGRLECMKRWRDEAPALLDRIAVECSRQ